MNTLYLETITLEVLFRYIVFIGLQKQLPEATTRVEVFLKLS